jgi:2-oxoglutarate ferredoxin oxidoreductase subunit gamma
MNEKIIVAGSGGQGSLTMGIFLAQIGVYEDRHVTWLPSYGAEKRGGFSFCDVVISDEEIFSPVVENPTAMILFDQRAFETYRNKISDNTIVVANSSLIKKSEGRGREIMIPASDIAKEISFIKAMNIVLAGAYIETVQMFKRESAYAVMETMLKGRPKEIIEKNILAFDRGAKFAKELGGIKNR